MHLLDVFYYYYFLFYKKIIRDFEPHFATILALSFSESLLINGVIDIVGRKWFCANMKPWMQMTILAIIILLNYLGYSRTGKARAVVQNKPSIGDSKKISFIITLLFFLTTASWLFWGPIYGKYLLETCKAEQHNTLH